MYLCVKNVRSWEGKCLNMSGSGSGQFGGLQYDDIFVIQRLESLGLKF